MTAMGHDRTLGTMNRRRFGKLLLGGAALSYWGVPGALAADAGHKFLVTIQAEGGWDPTSFCDPKTNTPGELIINQWAESADIQVAGNIPYAPFATNQAFFDKYHAHMMVVNGIDVQTNSHTAGVVHNWSGRLSEGYPSLTALYAAAVAPELPMTYLSFGGFSNTQGITRFTRVNDPNTILNVSFPNRSVGDDTPFLSPGSWDRVRAAHTARQERLVTANALTPRARRNRTYYQSAVESSTGLSAFAEALPPSDELQDDEQLAGNQWSSLKKQAQIALTAFKSGVAVAADLQLGGFDTHDDHDDRHAPLLGNIGDSLDYLWTQAEALGIADRLVVVIASDFGRTNHYNSGNGKDHWPISSAIVMEQNAPWADRVVGASDDLHNALTLDLDTLAPDPDGDLLHPMHLHAALRQYLGIDGSSGSTAFDLQADVPPLFT